MRVRDLGRIEGAVWLFGGPYSNLQATRALLDAADRAGVAGSRLVCTGDVVAYCADPAATVAAIRAAGCPVVAGNMEQSLRSGAPECGCGFADGSACDRMAGRWYAHADARIGPEDRAWMRACPDRLVFVHAGRRIAVLHGGASDVARFLWPVTPEPVFAEEWRHLEAELGPVDMVVSGHSGLPFLRWFAFGTWLNAGAIGMPPHDGRPGGCYAVLEPDGSARIARLDYDHAAAARAMREAGLTHGYDTALETGIWPSEDVLPPELRRLRDATARA